MDKMSKRERIQAALAAEPVDRVPVGFWRHWQGDDQDKDTLAAATLAFQREYDLDFIKFPVSSTFSVADYGVKHAYQGSPGGDRVYLERVIKDAADWDSIEPLDVRKGVYGWHLESLRKVVEQKEADTPLVVTIFNPLAMAFYVAGDETALVHLHRYPVRVEKALQALTQTCASFVEAAIEAGADGIFLSSRASSWEIMSEEEYQRFGVPGDMEVLKAAGKGWFNILHLHGQHPMFNLAAGYPVQALNWHDRMAYPSLKEAGELFRGALMGGIEQQKLLHLGSPKEIAAQAENAIRQTGGRRLILTPGCTYAVTVPHINLMAMRKAVEKSGGY